MRIVLSLLFCLLLVGCSTGLSEKGFFQPEKPDLTEHLLALYKYPKKMPEPSLKIIRCYEADPSIEIRLVNIGLLEPEQQMPSEWLYDLKNRKYLVHKKPLISSDDIDKICIKEMKPAVGGRIFPFVEIFFKQSAWETMRNISKDTEPKQLALIRTNKIIVSETLLSSGLTKSLRISDYNDPTMLEPIIDGLQITDGLDLYQIENEYLSWLENRVKSDPDDFELVYELCSKFMELEIKDCGRTFDVYKKAVKNGIFWYQMLMDLRRCYMTAEQYDDAITTYSELLSKHRQRSVDPGKEMIEKIYEAHIRCFLGDAFYAKEDKQKALGEFKKALSLIKTANPTRAFLAYSPNPEKFRSRMQAQKEKEMKIIHTMIRVVSSAL